MAFVTKDTVNPRKVIEFVLASHNDLKQVQQLLEEDPRLVNASVDMGGGDWETALDATAHMGRKGHCRHFAEKWSTLRLPQSDGDVGRNRHRKSYLDALPIRKG